MPGIKALTRFTGVELAKDDSRPLEQSAHTLTHAPHAHSSDVGVGEENWTPEETKCLRFETSDLLENKDATLVPFRRGEGKTGGHLRPIETRGIDTRLHKVSIGPTRP